MTKPDSAFRLHIENPVLRGAGRAMLAIYAKKETPEYKTILSLYDLALEYYERLEYFLASTEQVTKNGKELYLNFRVNKVLCFNTEEAKPDTSYQAILHIKQITINQVTEMLEAECEIHLISEQKGNDNGTGTD